MHYASSWPGRLPDDPLNTRVAAPTTVATLLVNPAMTKLKLSALAALTAVVSGCSTLPQPGAGTVESAPPVVFNKIRLSPVKDVRVPGMGALPFDGSLEDIQALEHALKILKRERTVALLTEQFELAGVFNEHYAQLAALRMAINVSTGAAIAQLQKTGGRSFKMAPGEIVVLLSDSDAVAQKISLRNPFDPFDVPHVQIASSSLGAVVEALRVISEVTGQIADSGVITGRASTMYGLEEIPRNIPFAMDNGTILVRRQTEKGTTFAFYNASDRIVEVPLKDLAYVPPPPPLSKVRQEAAPILANMVESVKQHFWDELDAVPNKILMHAFATQIVSQGPRLGPDGRITTDPALIEQSRRVGSNPKSPFMRAATLSVRAHNHTAHVACGEPPYQEYYDWVTNGKIGPQPGEDPAPRFPVLTATGRYATNLNVVCHRRDNRRPIYSQNYFIGESEVVQTAYSLVTDARVARILKDFDSTTGAMMDITQVLPIAGNAVSVLRCASGGNAQAVQAASKVLLAEHDYKRPFVAHIYQASLENDGLFGETGSQILDCAAMVPVIGNTFAAAGKGLKAASKGLKSDRLGKFFQVTSEQTDRIRSAAQYFRTPITTPRHVEMILEARKAAPPELANAITAGLALYTTAQKADNVADFKNGLENAPWRQKPEPL